MTGCTSGRHGRASSHGGVGPYSECSVAWHRDVRHAALAATMTRGTEEAHVG